MFKHKNLTIKKFECNWKDLQLQLNNTSLRWNKSLISVNKRIRKSQVHTNSWSANTMKQVNLYLLQRKVWLIKLNSFPISRLHNLVQQLQVTPSILAINCLKEYDDLLLNYTLFDIQIQMLQQKPSKWEPWWDKVQTIIQGMLFETFDSRNGNEILYQHKLASYVNMYQTICMYFHPLSLCQVLFMNRH